MRKYLFLLLSICAVIISCKKHVDIASDKIVTTPLSEADFNANYLSAHNNGNFNIWVQGLTSLNAQGNPVHNNSFLINGMFYDKYDSIIMGGVVNIDTFSFHAANTYLIQKPLADSSFFGRNIAVNLTPPNGQAPKFSTNIYLPKIVYAQLGSATANILQPVSDTIFWNADGNNINGIDVTISYDPSSYNNKNILGYFPSPVTKTIASVRDNGVFVIPQDVTTLFPVGAFLNISLSRGAAVLISYNEFKYTVHTYSYAFISNAKFP